ncbi:hypothetical protein RJT34_30381 [Clitoria ternatea]|uniref:Uncharacterized protein n=1 Tax=Clitoria ternatea TaxID=43366 RepID=A0AAN9EWW5_CLITE
MREIAPEVNTHQLKTHLVSMRLLHPMETSPMKATLPYDHDVEVVEATVQCYGNLPCPLTVNELHELAARRASTGDDIHPQREPVPLPPSPSPKYIPVSVEEEIPKEDPNEQPINIIGGLTDVMISTL